MKKVIFILVMLLSVTAFAQQGKMKGNQSKMTAEEQAARKVERLTTRLELSEAQQAELKVVFMEQAKNQEAMKAARRSGQDRPSKMEMTKMREAHQQAMETKMKEILTAEQFSKWQKMATMKRENRKGKN